MALVRYFVSPNGSQWKVRHNGIDYPYRTQEAAVNAARTAAEQSHANGWNAQVHVQRPDGRFRTEYTYGNDPVEYPG